jgi:hypothetical protein
MEIKTGHEWFKTLPRHIQEQFRHNGIIQLKNLEIYLTEKRSGPAFISGHFEWAKTREKDQYWLAIHSMYDNNKIGLEDFERLYNRFPEHSKRDEIINNYQIF